MRSVVGRLFPRLVLVGVVTGLTGLASATALGAEASGHPPAKVAATRTAAAGVVGVQVILRNGAINDPVNNSVFIKEARAIQTSDSWLLAVDGSGRTLATFPTQFVEKAEMHYPQEAGTEPRQ